MDLRPHIENINSQLAIAAEAGGDGARLLAERLVATLDAALRLTLQDVLAAAADEITCELAPGSVELRLRGRDPEFVVTPPAVDRPIDSLASDANEWVPGGLESRDVAQATSLAEGGMARINVRMPDGLKSRIEHAAGREKLSVNAWLVRAATDALEQSSHHDNRRAPLGGQRYTGWAR